MKFNKIGYFIAVIIGVGLLVLDWINDSKFSFIFAALGVTIIGVSAELYFKNKKDTKTENGVSRNMIDLHDERTILINAKSGETINYIMQYITIIAFIVAKLLEISLLGQFIILSLMLIRMVTTPIIKRYYETIM